jgi:hypothetical protein
MAWPEWACGPDTVSNNRAAIPTAMADALDRGIDDTSRLIPRAERPRAGPSSRSGTKKGASERD